eukprot:1978686-Prymnesium_polylepis.1
MILGSVSIYELQRFKNIGALEPRAPHKKSIQQYLGLTRPRRRPARPSTASASEGRTSGCAARTGSAAV